MSKLFDSDNDGITYERRKYDDNQEQKHKPKNCSKSHRVDHKKSYPLKDKNLNGFAQAFDKDELSIVYTTPFSGAEILPGQKAYMVDIWYQHKKVYSLDFQNIEALSGCHRRPKGLWLDKLMELKL